MFGDGLNFIRLAGFGNLSELVQQTSPSAAG
jgi:hypothetical protein